LRGDGETTVLSQQPRLLKSFLGEPKHFDSETAFNATHTFTLKCAHAHASTHPLIHIHINAGSKIDKKFFVTQQGIKGLLSLSLSPSIHKTIFGKNQEEGITKATQKYTERDTKTTHREIHKEYRERDTKNTERETQKIQ